MRLSLSLAALFTLSFVMLFGHEGHHHIAESSVPAPYGFLWWIGNFHPIFLQFPIVLMVMTGISELLFWYKQHVIFAYAARFMLIFAAIMVIPTALFGLALGYRSFPDYNDLLVGYFWWHMSFGIITALLILSTAYVREILRNGKLYYILLVITICSVVITGYLGGSITFGPYALIPPYFN